VYPDALVANVPGFRPLLLDLFVPRQAAAPLPAVVWIHGGAWMAGSNKRIFGADQGCNVVDRLVEAGFAVAAVQYRLSSEAPFPAQIHDVKSAIRWLRGHAPELGIDPDRIAAMGESAGGHLALLAALATDVPELEGKVGLTGPGSQVQAAVDWFGPADLLAMQSQSGPDAVIDHDRVTSPESRLIGAPLQSAPDRARLASPVSYVSPAAPPIMIVHGTADLVVPSAQSAELAAALESAGAPHELVPVDGADHGFAGADLGPIVRRSVAYLARVLRASSVEGLLT
jgi:acetyl esterase/lipase